MCYCLAVGGIWIYLVDLNQAPMDGKFLYLYCDDEYVKSYCNMDHSMYFSIKLCLNSGSICAAAIISGMLAEDDPSVSELFFRVHLQDKMHLLNRVSLRRSFCYCA